MKPAACDSCRPMAAFTYDTSLIPAADTTNATPCDCCGTFGEIAMNAMRPYG